MLATHPLKRERLRGRRHHLDERRHNAAARSFEPFAAIPPGTDVPAEQGDSSSILLRRLVNWFTGVCFSL
jgi:hypothetical protein